MFNLTSSMAQSISKRLDLIDAQLNRLAAAAGLSFFRADKDSDTDYDALTAGAWEAATPAATGTINWNTSFAVPTRAKSVLIYVSGTISFKAKSTTTNGTSTTGEQRTVIIANDGTTYFYGAAGTVTVRVIGWFA